MSPSGCLDTKALNQTRVDFMISIQAYYRKGSAYLALGKYTDAKEAFFRVAKARPQDRDARSKLAQCNKIIKQQKFVSALDTGDRAAESSTSSSWRSIELPGDYSGPRWADDEPCDTKFMEATMQHFKMQKMLPRRYVMRLLSEVKTLLRAESTLVEAVLPPQSDEEGAPERYFNICGDTHGQYYDLLHIFELNGMPSAENPYLFNGDFVDRGSFGVENVLVLLGWKLALPKAMHLNRGNHETINMNKMYGFDGEVKHKLDMACMQMFTQVFQSLPLVHVIDDKVMVVHGGLPSTDDADLAAIKRIDRFKEPPEGSLFADLLWTDPQPFQGRGPSKRGQGKSFGPDITRRFLERNGLQLLVRSHEVRDDGYLVEHDGKCVTVFSAPNYCDSMGNKGGIVRLNRKCEPTYVQFTEVPHPPVRPMQYSDNLMSLIGLM